jgi:hypothetical protein
VEIRKSFFFMKLNKIPTTVILNSDVSPTTKVELIVVNVHFEASTAPKNQWLEIENNGRGKVP